MLSALTRLVPRAFNRKSTKQQQTDVENVTADRAGGASVTAKPFTCRVLLLDDTELKLNVKVSTDNRRPGSATPSRVS